MIGFHGQTVLHDRLRALTVQLGDGKMLADMTGIPVVYDMRANDMVHGGQGAPLVPAYHQALAARVPFELSKGKPVVFVNIGGISNVTIISDNEDPIAFDTGPGNTLIDQWVSEKAGIAYDAGGSIASEGQMVANVGNTLSGETIFDLNPRNHSIAMILRLRILAISNFQTERGPWRELQPKRSSGPVPIRQKTIALGHLRRRPQEYDDHGRSHARRCQCQGKGHRRGRSGVQRQFDGGRSLGLSRRAGAGWVAADMADDNRLQRPHVRGRAGKACLAQALRLGFDQFAIQAAVEIVGAFSDDFVGHAGEEVVGTDHRLLRNGDTLLRLQLIHKALNVLGRCDLILIAMKDQAGRGARCEEREIIGVWLWRH